MNMNPVSKTKEPGDGAQDHHLLLLSTPLRSLEASRQAHFDLLLSILPLALGSAVQAQPFQPERDSFQDQSSPPQPARGTASKANASSPTSVVLPLRKG